MKVQSAMICDAAASYEGKLSVLGSFDTISASEFPVYHHHCALAIRIFSNDEDVGEHFLEAKFIDPDGKSVLSEGNPKIKIICPKLHEDAYFISLNYVFDFNGLPIPSPGQYRFDICLDDDLILAEIPLQVMKTGS